MFEGIFGELAGLAGPVGGRVVLTLLVLAGAFVLRRVAERAIRRRLGDTRGVPRNSSAGATLADAGLDDRYSAYWLRKISQYAVWAVAGLLVFLIWTEFGRRAGFTIGLFSAGVAFALQNVLSSFAAWIGILTGKVFRVGDRVMMGGVRGDVIDLSPLRTTIMEIGSPGAGENSDVWVSARQHTGRVVTISNKAFFEEPIYNYSQGFDYIWEEIAVPLSYKTDWERGTAILLEEVEEATREFREASAEALAAMARRYLLPRGDVVDPRVFVRLTDSWVEASARFVIPVRSARRVKSDVSERVLRRYAREGITIASATSEIVGFPTLRVEGLDGLRGARDDDAVNHGPDGSGARLKEDDTV